MNYATCFPFEKKILLYVLKVIHTDGIGDEWPRLLMELMESNIRNFFSSFFRVTSPGHQGYLGATIVSNGLSDWQALGIELCLTFVITLVYLVKITNLNSFQNFI